MAGFAVPPAGVLVPRRAVEAEIHERLSSGARPHARDARHPLLVITGSRGSGKTSLLAALASRWEDENRAGVPVALARLEPLSCTPEVLGSELARLGRGLLPRRRQAQERGRPNGVGAGAAFEFDALLASLRDRSRRSVLLLDDITEIQTLTYYPGVDRPLERFLEALANPGGGGVIATTRFGYRFARSFPEIPRYELPPWSAEEAERLGFASGDAAQLISATRGVPAYFLPLARAREHTNSTTDALSLEMSPGGTVESECRATLQELLHRARGYGACKSVLRALATEEGMNLTEVARRLDRTPGATRDYLRWLEEVGLLESRHKRFYFSQPVIGLWLRLYGTGRIRDESERRREVDAYLQTCAEEAEARFETQQTAALATADDAAEPGALGDYTYPAPPAQEESELLVEID